jgi:hypothetical protein
MEINYELILKYLGNNNFKKSTENIFTTQKNLYNYSYNFPQKFKDIFSDNYFRFGVTVYDNNNNNISFWSALLNLIDIDKKFIIPFENDELSIINNFKNDLVNKYSRKNISNFLKKYEKNDFKERIKLIPDFIIIQYIVDIININIFIFDFKNENINVLYNDQCMNPMKSSILLSKYDDFWEPILLNKKDETQKIFKFIDPIIKKLLNLDIKIEYLNENIINKKFTFTTINDIIELEINNIKELNFFEKSLNNQDKKINEFDVNELSLNVDTNLNINSNEKIISDVLKKKSTICENIIKFNKTKLKRMKLDELNILVNQYNINIVNKQNKKLITKDDIIEQILISFNNE